jgi:hypothetical protein
VQLIKKPGVLPNKPNCINIRKSVNDMANFFFKKMECFTISISFFKTVLLIIVLGSRHTVFGDNPSKNDLTSFVLSSVAEPEPVVQQLFAGAVAGAQVFEPGTGYGSGDVNSYKKAQNVSY